MCRCEYVTMSFLGEAPCTRDEVPLFPLNAAMDVGSLGAGRPRDGWWELNGPYI